VPLDRIPRGELLVQVTDPAGAKVPSSRVRVLVEGGERGIWPPPVGVADPKTGVWRFDRLPAGRARVVVTGDHVRETSAEVQIAAGQATEATVALEPAGALTWSAALYNGEAPEKVTVALLDASGKGVVVWWQVRSAKVLSEPRRGVEVTLPAAEGIAYGIPAGTYRLRGKSPGDDVDEQEVTVEPGATASVRLTFRE
jgi:hypothetical protein